MFSATLGNRVTRNCNGVTKPGSKETKDAKESRNEKTQDLQDTDERVEEGTGREEGPSFALDLEAAMALETVLALGNAPGL